MLLIAFVILGVFYAGILSYALYQIVTRQRYVFLLIFLVFYLPNYLTFQSIFYAVIGSDTLLLAWQVLKELIVFIAVVVMLSTWKGFARHRFHFTPPDFFLLALTTLALVYVFLPIGSATLPAKALYFRNMLVPAGIFFIGRNYRLPQKDEKLLISAILVLIFMGFIVNSAESLTGIHLQKVIGYPDFAYHVLELDPKGYYGLDWNFERGPNTPRFAGFYANSLESGAVAIMLFSFCFFFFWHTKWRQNQLVFGGAMMMTLFANYVAFGRSSMVGMIMCFLFIAYLLKYYHLILLITLGTASVIFFILLFASDDTRYLVLDTLSFRQASSLGHLLGWLEGVESMIANPEGIGLAASGSSQLVEDDLQIGGENQFIIYGVQLGVLGLILYIGLVLSAILYCIKAFRNARSINEKLWPFVAGSTRFGLLLPLFTSNLELFLFLIFFSSWMVGYSLQIYRRPIVEEQLTIQK